MGAKTKKRNILRAFMNERASIQELFAIMEEEEF